MAVNTSRNMNAELIEGATDGRYKKVVNNRGGVVEPSTYANRDELDDVWFGIHETQPKDVPGMVGYYPSPNYVPTREPDRSKW
jgi:hypothetical protein